MSFENENNNKDKIEDEKNKFIKLRNNCNDSFNAILQHKINSYIIIHDNNNNSRQECESQKIYKEKLDNLTDNWKNDCLAYSKILNEFRKKK